jgi:hypothetical protein
LSEYPLFQPKHNILNVPRVTIGGVNGPICHGAGRQHQTVNDSIVAIEYVDANGVHRTVFDPGHLKAAAGCFGLLGIVTHITFSLDKMRYAVLKPVKPDISLAIPPLSRADSKLTLFFCCHEYPEPTLFFSSQFIYKIHH